RRDGRDEADRPGRRRNAAQGMGRGGRAARQDERGGRGRAGRAAGARLRMTGAPASPPPFGKFFLPGPTDVHPEVLAAMLRPMIGHRSSAMEQMLQGMAPRLQALCRTGRTVLIGTTSATGFMEMAVRNGVRHRALSVVN